MQQDKLSQLRHEQRLLDKALARRARAKKALDAAEEGVRLARRCADAIMLELQAELVMRGAPGNGALDPAPHTCCSYHAAGGDSRNSCGLDRPQSVYSDAAPPSAPLALEYRAYLCTVCGDTHTTVQEPVLFKSHQGYALRQEGVPDGA